MEIYNNTKIAVRNLDLYYGEKQALKDVNMNIKEGKSNCTYRTFQDVVKSTFIRTLNKMNDLIDNVKSTEK